MSSFAIIERWVGLSCNFVVLTGDSEVYRAALALAPARPENE